MALCFTLFHGHMNKSKSKNKPSIPETEDRVAQAMGWIVGDALRVLPETIRELVAPRPGWPSAGWASHMRYLAARCEELHPHRADDLRRAATILEGGNDKGRG